MLVSIISAQIFTEDSILEFYQVIFFLAALYMIRILV